MTIPLVSFSGLATGLDTNALVSSLVSVARQPILRLQYTQSNLNAQSKRLADIKTKLEALKTAAKGLDERNDVLTVKATSANETFFTAVAAPGTNTGSYNIQVTGLANAERTYSDPIASDTQTGLVGTGTLSITVNGVQTNIAIDQAVDTLATVVTKINDSGADVTASLVYTGSAWRLQVAGNQTGSANAVTFAETGTIALDLDATGNQLQAATNATFTVDGIAMSRSTNQVADAIPGVVLTLKSVQAAGTTALTIDRDPAALQTAVEAFVKAYNDVQTALSAEFAWTGKAKGPDSLAGDSTLRGLQGRLRTVAGQSITAADPYSTLASIGVTSGKDGTLTLDSTKLKDALATSAEDVTTLLAKVTGGDGIAAQLVTVADDYTKSTSGMITARIDTIAQRVKDIDSQILRMEDRLDKYEETLRAQFSALEALVSSLQGQGAQMMSVFSSLMNQNNG